MNRRKVLRLLGAAGALPFLETLAVEDLLAAGQALHARAAARAGQALRALTQQEGATVAAIAEMIIPRTDTPGAIDAGVPAFIDLIVGEWYDDDDRAAFRAGLRETDARSVRAHGSSFVELAEAGQRNVLGELEAESLALRGSGAHPAPFFSTMKYLTLYGYYTSQAGAIEELNYEIVPGRFNGCVPVVPGGR
jgi:hypothetical protein